MHFFLFFEFIFFHLILMCVLYSVFSTTILTPYFHSVTSSTISAHSHNTQDIDSTKHHISTIHVPNIHPIPLTRSTFLTGPTRTIHPVVPFQTGPPAPSQDSQQSGQKTIFVVFEVLGGLLALGLFLCLGRCCYQYRKAPKRDRIAEVLNRHNLQRELEELERNPQILRRLSLREPAPPYYPAPPSYEVTSSPSIAGTNYTDMDTHDLPSSSPQPSILIPPRPAG
jgi:hypothetical protein